MSGFRSVRALGLAAAVLAAIAFPARADEVPAPLQARLLATISAHVFNLPSTGELHVLIVYPESAREGSREAQTLSEALLSAEAHRFRISTAAYKGQADLKAELAKQRPHIVFATSSLDAASVAELVEACDVEGLLTVTENASNVRLGVILGFTLLEAKPKLVINLPHAQKQKVRLSSALVSLAQIVR